MKLNPLETAYAELLEENYGPWAGIARAYAPSNDHEDLLQEILLQVWRGLPKFEGRSHRGTWAYRVALNTALAWDRSARNRQQKLKIESHDVSQVDIRQINQQRPHNAVVRRRHDQLNDNVISPRGERCVGHIQPV